VQTGQPRRPAKQAPPEAPDAGEAAAEKQEPTPEVPDGLLGRVLATLVRLIERPIQGLSDDARYTVNVIALAFLIGSVSLLAYALFFAR